MFKILIIFIINVTQIINKFQNKNKFNKNYFKLFELPFEILIIDRSTSGLTISRLNSTLNNYYNN